MINNDKWIENLRKKMETHQETPPEGLWEDIAKSLPQSPATPITQQGNTEGAKHIVLKRRKVWIAAAAIVTLLIGGGVSYWIANQHYGEKHNGMAADYKPDDIEKAPTVIAQNHHESENSTTPSVSDTPSISDTPSVSVTPNVSSVSSVSDTPNTSGTLGASDIPNVSSVPSVPSNSIESLNPTIAGNLDASEKSVMVTSDPSLVSSEQNILAELEREISSEKSNHRHLAIGLHAANNLIGESNKSNVVDYAMSNSFIAEANNAYSFYSMRKMVFPDYFEKKHHYQPVSIGLTGKIGLTDKMAVTTGVVYTLLRSDFTTNVGSSSIDRKQTLHYIGVPLTLMYKVWELGGFSSYVSAGGEADYNISASMSTEGDKQVIDRDRPQLSAIASVGAQYNFTPYVGLYLEPGVRYYFDNGSHIDNVFKDKKKNFYVQFGLRFNIVE